MRKSLSNWWKHLFGPEVQGDELAQVAEEAASRIKSPESGDGLWFAARSEVLLAAGDSAHMDTFVAATMDFGRYYLGCGLVATSLQPDKLTQHGLQLVERNGSLANRRAMTHLRGVVLRGRGFPNDAMPIFMRALELAEQQADLVAQARELSAIGACAYDIGWYKGTIDHCRRALAVLSSLGRADVAQDVRMVCNQSIAEACLHMIYKDDSALGRGGYLAEGLRTIQNAVREAGEPQTVLEMSLAAAMRLTQANLLGRVGRLDDMEEAIAACDKFAQLTGNPKTIFHARIARGVLNGLRVKSPVAVDELERAAQAEPEGSDLRMDALVAAAQVADAARDAKRLQGVRVQILHEWSLRQTLANQERFDNFAKAATRTDTWEAAIAESIDTFAVLSEIHDDDTGAHVFRVGALSARIAAELGWSPQACEQLDFAARLHDVGKCAIHVDILSKPGMLTSLEMEAMMRHTTIGSELLTRISHPVMEIAADIALSHHERWDGQGYPNRISGAQIPIAARIAAVADVFDALTHKRCYKGAWPVPKALETIESMRGLNFDPMVADAALKVIRELIVENGEMGTEAVLSARAADNPTAAARAFLGRIQQPTSLRSA